VNKRELLKKRIQDRQPVFGTFLKNNSPAVAEMLGYAGFDFVIIDCEHSNYSYSDTENMIRACDVADIASIVRTPSCDSWHVHHALETGATGVQIPSIATVDDAREAALETAFYPAGRRSPAQALRAAHYGCFSGEKGYVQTKTESNLTVVHVESIDMAAKVEELCAIPQIDVLFVGPGDLSMSMGKPGQLSDPEVVKVIEDIIKRGLAGGKAMGILCANEQAVKKYVDLGVTYIAYSSDTGMIVNAFKSINKSVFSQYR